MVVADVHEGFFFFPFKPPGQHTLGASQAHGSHMRAQERHCLVFESGTTGKVYMLRLSSNEIDGPL